MILATTLLGSDSTLILPILLFVGIICGIIKKDSMKNILITSFIAFTIGYVLSFIISLINIFYTEGGFYAIAVMQYSLFYIIIYILVGCLGSSLGYHVIDEINTQHEIKEKWMDLSKVTIGYAIPIEIVIITIVYIIGFQLFFTLALINLIASTVRLLFFFIGILERMMKHEELIKSDTI